MFTKRFIRLKDISVALAKENNHPKCYHFTYAYFGNKLLSIGVNKTKTHPYNLHLPYLGKDTNENISDQIGIHSELDCIIKLGKNVCTKLTFFNFRVDKSGNLTMSKPCNGCSHLLNQVGYKEVYYTNNEGELEKLNK